MEVFVRIDGVELWKVKDSRKEFLSAGQWTIVHENSEITAKVGDVVWRLNANLLCLKPDERSYVFAIHPEQSIFFCVNLPQNVSEDEVIVLETVLKSFTTFERATGEQISDDAAEPKSDKIINVIEKATSHAVKGMSVTATFIGNKIAQGAEAYRKRTQSCTSPANISEKTKQRVDRIHRLSQTVSGISAAAVDAVATFTSRAAEVILSNVKRKEENSEGADKKSVLGTVAVSAAEIYESMIEAFQLVSGKTVDATKTVVAHKFGDEVAEVAGQGAAAVKNSANAIMQSSRIGSLAILKATAKKTAVGYIKDKM